MKPSKQCKERRCSLLQGICHSCLSQAFLMFTICDNTDLYHPALYYASTYLTLLISELLGDEFSLPKFLSSFLKILICDKLQLPQIQIFTLQIYSVHLLPRINTVTRMDECCKAIDIRFIIHVYGAVQPNVSSSVKSMFTSSKTMSFTCMTEYGKSILV